MAVHVKLSTTLRDRVPGYDAARGLMMDIDQPVTAAHIAQELGLPGREIKIVMLNGTQASLENMVRDGDRLAFFPAVGGG